MYKQVKTLDGAISQTLINKVEDNAFIPFDLANTDYQTFKAQVLADEAQLEDADGVLMTAEEAKAFVATLP